jgi:hypothetical protein
LLFLQPLWQGNATEFTFTFAVCTPHGASDVLTGNGFNHHRTCFLHDPNKRMRDIQYVAVSQTFLFEQLEPVIGNGVQRSTFTWHTV